MSSRYLKDTAPTYYKKNRFRVSIIIVFIVALVLIALAFLVLPFTDVSEKTGVSPINGMTLKSPVVSLNAELSTVFVTINYADGTERSVALSELGVFGLNLKVEGEQNVSLSFGDYQQIVTIKVVSTEVKLEYVASTGGRIEGEALQHVPSGGNASTVIAIPEVGYRFDKWADDDPNPSRSDKNVSVDRTLVASFVKIQYTVVFYYPDGTTAKEELVNYGESATKVPDKDETNMFKYGHRFVEWSEKYDKITADTFIHPTFEKYATDILLEMTLGVEGKPLGSTNLHELGYYPKDMQSSFTVTANPDRVFMGWRVKNSAGVWQSLTPNNESIRIAIGDINNLILFATSRESVTDTYSITFTTNQYADAIEIKADFVYLKSEITFTSMSNKYGESIILGYDEPIGDRLITPEQINGFTFKGWYAKNASLDENGNLVKITQDAKFTKPTELIAIWEKNAYTVTFLRGDSNNFNETSVSVLYQDTLASPLTGEFPNTIPTKDKYIFKGWYLLAEGDVPTSTIIDKTYKINGNIRVKPIFEVITYDLNITLTGSGTVVQVLSGGGTTQISTGTIKLEADANYTFKFIAGNGFTLRTITSVISGSSLVQTINAQEGTWSISLPTANIKLSALFQVTIHQITVTNGDSSSSGNMDYQDTDADGEVVDKTTNDQLFYFSAPNNVTRHLNITAPEGSFIKSITLNDTTINNIPSQAINYTLVLSNITSATNIKVSYEKFSYNISIPKEEEADNGGIKALDNNPIENLPMGSSPSFIVEAKDGFYIKNLLINGVAINPYTLTDNYKITNMFVNGQRITSINNAFDGNIDKKTDDMRVTGYQIQTLNIKSDLVLSVEFATISYNINISTVGIGSVNKSNQTINYNDNFNVIATAVSGYYVYSSVVNGQENVYDDAPSSQQISLKTVKNDYSITFTFKVREFALSFTENESSKGSSEIEYIDDNGELQKIDCNKTYFVGATSNKSYTINAKKGYVISSIIVDEVEVDISFNATRHILKFDAISANHTIEVKCMAIDFAVNITLINAKEGSSVYASATVGYGEDVTIKITIGDLQNIKSINSSLSGVFDKNTGTYTISNVESKIEVVIVFEDKNPEVGETPFAINLIQDDNGTLTSSVTEIDAGGSVTYQFEPKTDAYILKYLIINGEIVLTEGTEYTVTDVQANQNVQVIFELQRFRLNIEMGLGGILTPDKEVYNYGEEIKIKIIVNTGYKIDELKIGDKNFTEDELIKINNDKNYIIGSSFTNKNIDITIAFAPLPYTLYIDKEGNGKVEDTDSIINTTYGKTHNLNIMANEKNYIFSIFVNDVSIDPFTLINAKIDTDIQKCTQGLLNIEITRDTRVRIVFKANTYKAYIAETFNGTTKVRTDANADYSNGQGLDLSAGSSLDIFMEAFNGYHIAKLIINGVENNDWQKDNETPNNNRSIEYKIGEVTGNVNIYVEYIINQYSVKVVETNNSPNFKKYDTIAETFGTIGIYGYNDDNNIFAGITHGQNITFIITPILSKGYYISSFVIVWDNPDTIDGSGNERLDLTDKVNRNGGQYVFKNLRGNLQSVEVIFLKETFNYTSGTTVDQLGSTFASTGSLTAEFSNPNRNADGSFDNLQLVDNKYEYGLAYTIKTLPGVGYHRTSFKVNSEERNSYVRDDKYNGTIRSHMDVLASYVINTYNVSIKGDLGGFVGVFKDNQQLQPIKGELYINVTHGTELVLKAISNYGSEGYYISSFSVNNDFVTIPDPNQAFNYDITATSDINAEVRFLINYYNVSFAGIVGGNSASASPSRVQWGNNSTINVNTFTGYEIASVLVNGRYLTSSEIASLKLIGYFVIEDIKQIQNINIEFVPIAYDILVDTEYENGSIYLSFNNQIETEIEAGVITGAKHFDNINILFKPSNGYHLAIQSLVVKMRDLNGNWVTIDANKLINYDANNPDYQKLNISSMNGEVNIYARFVIKNYTIVLDNTANGTLTVTGGSKTIDHNAYISFNMLAKYGYHLSSLRINGIEIKTSYKKLQDNTYQYSTTIGSSELVVNDELINGDSHNTIKVTALFDINSFESKLHINDKEIINEITDPTLTIMMSASFNFGNATKIDQKRTAGYSITSIGLYQLNGTQISAITQGFILSSIYVDISGNIMNQLDYHDNNNNKLLIKYTTTIDMHNSKMETYLYETNKNPLDSNANFGLTKQYSKAEQNGKYEYGVTATITSTIAPGATNLYRFAGYQELITTISNGITTSEWVYVKNGIREITILNDGRTMTYVIHEDREFRAVYYRLYKMEVKIYPEHKYISGNSSENMVYQKYASLTAVASYDKYNKPNFEGNELVIADADGDSTNSTYVFYVDSGAKLALTSKDSITQTNPSGITRYYYVTGEQLEFTQDPQLNSGSLVTTDRMVYAMFGNTLQLSVSQETVGGLTAGEGGTITFKIGSSTTTLTGNKLAVVPNSIVRFELSTNPNFRFASLQKRISTGTDSLGRLIFSDNWVDVTATTDGMVKYYYDTTSKKQIMEFRAIENGIYRATYYKTFNVSHSINYVTDKGTAIQGDMPTWIDNDCTAPGTYDYNSIITYAVNAPASADSYGMRWQFVGFFVNGVNMYEQLGSSYPSDFTASYKLYQWNSSDQRDGLPLNNVINLKIEAKFVAIFNILIENSYTFVEGAHSKEFYAANVSYKVIEYDKDVPATYEISRNLEDKNKIMFQALNEHNASNYNVWDNNILKLEANVQPGFKFNSWQYKTENGQFVNLDIHGDYVTLNSFASPKFEFLVSALYRLPRVDVDGKKVVYIRPLFVKQEDLKILPRVYQYDENNVDAGSAGKVAPFIVGSNSLSGTYDYYQEKTLDPRLLQDYEFLGWFYNGAKIEYTGATSESNPFSYNATNHSLKVRLFENYEIEAKYIKQWIVSVTVKNVSGIAVKGDAPYISVYGADNTIVKNNIQVYDVRLRAGSTIKFGLHNSSSTTFDVKFDKFKRISSMVNQKEQWATGSDFDDLKTGDTNITNIGNDFSSAILEIKGNETKTITIEYQSFDNVNYTGIYKGSSIRLSDAMYKALGGNNWGDQIVTDGGVNDKDNAVNGSILITGVPHNADYSGIVGHRLFGMDLSNYIVYKNSNGDAIDMVQKLEGTQKEWQLNYYSLNSTAIPFVDNGNKGTADKPYIISDVRQLNYIELMFNDNDHTLQNIYFKMNANIVLGNRKPMCQEAYGFDGNFDGDNYALSAINITGSDHNIGLFSKTNGATISNLQILGTNNISGGEFDNVGTLIGKANNTELFNVSQASGTIAVTGNNNVGGLVGYLVGNKNNKMSLTSNNRVAFASLQINGNNNIGGLIGYSGSNAGAINNVNVNNITVVGKINSGGIIGLTEGNKVGNIAVSNATSTQANIGIDSSSASGGIVGQNGANNNVSYVNINGATISASNDTLGAVNNVNKTAGGGLIGINYGELNNAYLDGTINLQCGNGGGMVGANYGAIYSSKTNNNSNPYIYVSFTPDRSAGNFSPVAGYNEGNVGAQNKQVSANNGRLNSGWVTDGTLMYITTNGNTNFNSDAGDSSAEAIKTSQDKSSLSVGGIVGYNNGESAIVDNTYNNSKIFINRRLGEEKATFTYLGGIVGYSSNGYVKNSNSKGADNKLFAYVWVDSGIYSLLTYRVGGIVAETSSNSKITNCSIDSNTWMDTRVIGRGKYVEEYWKYHLQCYAWGTSLHYRGAKHGNVNIGIYRIVKDGGGNGCNNNADGQGWVTIPKFNDPDCAKDAKNGRWIDDVTTKF